jgi:hypothetical protein
VLLSDIVKKLLKLLRQVVKDEAELLTREFSVEVELLSEFVKVCLKRFVAPGTSSMKSS